MNVIRVTRLHEILFLINRTDIIFFSMARCTAVRDRGLYLRPAAPVGR